jgi:protein-S-isoprenylcysteine O-methyltransferase Ste14
MSNLKNLAKASPETRHNAWRRGGQMLFSYNLIAAILFISAGTVIWLYPWLYVGIIVLIMIMGAFFIPLDMLAERGSKKENVERWDKVLTNMILPAMFCIYLVSGLDFRWKWSGDMPVKWHIVGSIVFMLGCALEVWAMVVNRFFSTAVRIQSDRGHTVCSSGPYKFICHPGYVGIILYYGFTPVFLGSLWALVPATVTVILMIVRTALEDRTLQNKLPGYREYAGRVRYRLVPGIW